MTAIAITDFLTEAEIAQAIKLYDTFPTGFARVCAQEIIVPVLPRINQALGQENDPRYLAYMVEYALSRVRGIR